MTPPMNQTAVRPPAAPPHHPAAASAHAADSPHRAHPLAIRVCEAVIVAYGLVAIALMTFPDLARLPFGWMFFGLPLSPELAAVPVQFAIDAYTVIMGGIMLGWMIALFGLVRHEVAQGSRGAGTFAVASVAAWFATDSLASIAIGNAINVLPNVALAAPLLGALAWARPRPAKVQSERRPVRRTLPSPRLP